MAKKPVTDTENKPGLLDIPDLPPITDKAIDFEERPVKEGAEDSPGDPEAHRGAMSTGNDSYDPTIHTYPPKETAAGKWRRQGGRGKGATAKTEGPINGDYRKQAQQTALLYANINRAIMGDGAEVVKEEIVPMTDAWENYYMVNGLREVPPWLQVALSSGMYSYGVATRPKVKDRVAKALFKFAIAIKLLKPKQVEPENAHVNSRDHQQRENKTGEVSSSA